MRANLIDGNGTGETQDLRARVPEREQPAPDLIAIYLREIGTTPLVNHDRALELVRKLHEAREELSKIALNLPSACRERVLREHLDGPARGYKWPLSDLEIFYARLLRYHQEHTTRVCGRLSRNPTFQEIIDEFDRPAFGTVKGEEVYYFANPGANQPVKVMKTPLDPGGSIESAELRKIKQQINALQ